MTAASNYTEKNLLSAAFRGVTFPLPTGTYIALHTGDPGEDGSASEVLTADWPSYVRRHAENGGAIGSGWSAPLAGDTSQTKNLIQITFPTQNGTGAVIVTHMSVWDASSGGNMLAKTALDTARTVNPLDVLVFDINQIVFTAS